MNANPIFQDSNRRDILIQGLGRLYVPLPFTCSSAVFRLEGTFLLPPVSPFHDRFTSFRKSLNEVSSRRVSLYWASPNRRTSGHRLSLLQVIPACHTLNVPSAKVCFFDNHWSVHASSNPSASEEGLLLTKTLVSCSSAKIPGACTFCD